MRSVTIYYSRFIHKFYIGIIFFWLLITLLLFSYSQKSTQTIENQDDYVSPPEVESQIVNSALTVNYSRDAAGLNILIEAPENKTILEYETYELVSSISSNITNNYDIHRVLYDKAASNMWSEARSLLRAYFSGLYQATAAYNLSAYIVWGSADVFTSMWWNNYSVTANPIQASNYALIEGLLVANTSLHLRSYGYLLEDILVDYYQDFVAPQWNDVLQSYGVPLDLNDARNQTATMIETFFPSFLQEIQDESYYEPFNSVYQFLNYSTDSWNDSSNIYYSLSFGAFMPCRILIVEDKNGDRWLITMAMELMLFGGHTLPPEMMEKAEHVRATMYKMMDLGAEGDF